MNLIGLLLLIALVFGVWILVLDKDSPYNRRHAQTDSAATAAPTENVAPEETPAETEASATPDPETTAGPTPEVLPTPTPQAQDPSQASGSYAATAEPDGATAKPARATARPAAATAEPDSSTTAAATAEPVESTTAGATVEPGESTTTGATAEPIADDSAASTARPTALATAARTAVPAPSDTPKPTARYQYQLPATRDPNGPPDRITPSPRPEEAAANVTPSPKPEEVAETPDDVIATGRVTLVNGGNLNLRSKASTEGDILAGLPNGTIIDVLGYEDNWVHVRADSQEGYVSKDYLTIVETAATEAPQGGAEGAQSVAQAVAQTGDLEHPYMLEVDRGMQVLRVYTLDENGTYTLLAREMICSTDSFDRKPPNGTYLMNGEKQRWLTTFTPGSYAQYATRITGHILFHSVPYKALRPDSLDTDAYADLGVNASIGCVRLLCADAKWIYDNVPAGTVVKFVTGERDEAKLAELAPPALVGGLWDPTDSNESNPDYSADYENAHPVATPVPNVTPAPTAPWTPDTYE